MNDSRSAEPRTEAGRDYIELRYPEGPVGNREYAERRAIEIEAILAIEAEGRADAESKVRLVRGWLENIAVAHYYDGSLHANSDPNCRICKALAPFIEDENVGLKARLSEVRPDGE